MAVEPVRRAVIDGRTVLVVDRRPPLPPSLQLLLEGGRGPDGRLYPPMRTMFRQPLRLGGPAASCLESSNGNPELDHRMSRWIDGMHIGTDGVTRYLSLHACADCGAVCVRDQSVDEMDDLPTGRRPSRRRDLVIGWYTGARPRQRVYS